MTFLSSAFAAQFFLVSAPVSIPVRNVDEGTSVWTILLLVCVAGAVGGIINATTSDDGFIVPGFKEGDDGEKVFLPGFVGNAFVGAVAAGVSWGLYGPFAAYPIIGAQPPEPPEPSITIAAFFGAVLIGIGGAKWLTDEVDKRVLQRAAAEAAGRQPDSGKALEMETAKPMRALELARELRAVGEAPS